ncbi:MAG: FAD-binding oxidoreductase [Parvibaculum sp.]|nr:FAD-binding oxidoreductase [Parvibaculum sp.]
MKPSADTLARMKAIVGPKGYTDDAAEMAPYLVERRDRYQGRAAAMLSPASTSEVSALMKIAHETNTKIVPQGGNTGLVGGQIPFESGEEVILSLTRMNHIGALDALNKTLTVEAGVTLQAAQEAAAAAGLLFPLSLASEGTCQIGGNLATNAGGTAVLRYGNARELVLGLEVVLADGEVWDGRRGLRKDNTGYDLKHLFMGSEGTLGIITGAVLKLFPAPQSVETAFVAVPDVEAAVVLLRRADAMNGGLVTGFELMPRVGIDFVLRHQTGSSDPLNDSSPWYVLVELSAGAARDGRLREVMEALLAAAMEADEVSDATIAASDTQRAKLWAIREGMSEVQRLEGGSIKHDISVPVSCVAEFITLASAAVTKSIPGLRVVPFGHVGDGNIHFNLSQPVGADRAAFMARWDEMSDIVHEIVRGLGGSISAEHGIGRMKRDEMAATKSVVEMEMMRAVKKALDPKGILNPGKVV